MELENTHLAEGSSNVAVIFGEIMEEKNKFVIW